VYDSRANRRVRALRLLPTPPERQLQNNSNSQECQCTKISLTSFLASGQWHQRKNSCESLPLSSLLFKAQLFLPRASPFVDLLFLHTRTTRRPNTGQARSSFLLAPLFQSSLNSRPAAVASVQAMISMPSWPLLINQIKGLDLLSL